MRQGKPSSRLGRGEYEWNQEFSTEHMRNLFLEAVQRVEPAVLRSLEAGPFILFQRLQRGGERLGGNELREAVSTWLHRWHLPCPPKNDDWCERRAFHTMGAWMMHAGWQGNQWALSRVGVADPKTHTIPGPIYNMLLPPKELQFTFTLKSPDFSAENWNQDAWWDPTLETRSAATARIRAAFEAALDAYTEQLSRYVERVLIDFKATPSKRQLDHFEWLARYQVSGEKFSQIAKDSPQITGAAVKMAVWRLARQIDLPRRTLKPKSHTSAPPGPQPKRGRPRGTKDSKVKVRHRVR